MSVWGGLDALGMEIGEERVVDEGTVERVNTRSWRINILGHEALVGAEIASNILRGDGGEYGKSVLTRVGAPLGARLRRVAFLREVL